MQLTTTVSVNLPDTESTQRLGEWLGNVLEPSTVLLLKGDLGSGKTTFVQGLGEGLNISETIDSPTFTLINEYLSGRLPLYHVDLYRLETEDINGLYLETYWEGAEVEPGILAIEWADKLTYFPPDPLNIDLAYGEADHKQVGRTARLQATRADHQALLGILSTSGVNALEL
ncbi:MAG: tRNA (adenosine(37)-N6)-threonylcarbamoyltransferase complex ATPase subunit type 1 TsaE [Cyanobacteria bacterium P01_H01_bin.119]